MLAGHFEFGRAGPSWVERRIVAELDGARERGEVGSILRSA